MTPPLLARQILVESLLDPASTTIKHTLPSADSAYKVCQVVLIDVTFLSLTRLHRIPCAPSSLGAAAAIGTTIDHMSSTQQIHPKVLRMRSPRRMIGCIDREGVGPRVTGQERLSNCACE